MVQHSHLDYDRKGGMIEINLDGLASSFTGNTMKPAAPQPAHLPQRHGPPKYLASQAQPRGFHWL